MKDRDFYSVSTQAKRLVATGWVPAWVLTSAALGLAGCGTLMGPSTPPPAQSPYGQATSSTPTTSPASPTAPSPASPQPPAQQTAAPETAQPAKAPMKSETEKPRVVRHKPRVKHKVVVHAAPKPKPVETHPAEPTVAPAPVKPEAAAPLMLTADKLPYTAGDWTLELNWDNQHPGECRLVSKHLTMNDGYDNTAVWADMRSDHMDIHTGSNIDLSYQGTGIQFDDAALVPVKGLVGETGVDVPGHFSDPMAHAKKLVIHLGFWPTWPKTQTQQVQIPLDGAGVLMPSFLNCKQL